MPAMPNRAVRIMKRSGGGGGLVPSPATIFLKNISLRRYVWVGEIWEEGRCVLVEEIWEEGKKEGVHVGRPVPPSISAIA